MSLTVAQAGKRGGLRLLRTRGRDYFVVIGRKGQAAMRRKYPDMATQWGKLGGRPRKLTLRRIVGEKSNKTTKEVCGPACVCLSPPPDYTTELRRLC